MELPTESIPDRIRVLMKKFGLDQSRFADEAGIIRQTLSSIMTGRTKPALDTTTAIKSKWPEVDLNWLLTGNGSPFVATAPLDVVVIQNALRLSRAKVRKLETELQAKDQYIKEIEDSDSKKNSGDLDQPVDLSPSPPRPITPGTRAFVRSQEREAAAPVPTQLLPWTQRSAWVKTR